MLHLDFHDPVSRRFLRELRRQMFVTTPLSMVNRLTGVEAFTDPLSLPFGTTLGGNIIAGGAAQFGVVPPTTTTLTLTAALYGNQTLLIASTGGLAITPPAATGTGNKYRVIATAAVTGGNFTLDAKAGNASDVFYGWIQSNKSGTCTPWPTASNSNLITLNGTTTGFAAAGDWFEIQDVGTHLWLVSGWTVQSGTVATPFSNH